MTLQYKLTTVCKPLSIWRNSILLSFYFLLSFMHFASYATTDFTLFENDQKLYSAPYSNYEYLLSLSPFVDQQSNDQHILWLQQKAALEHLLIKPKAFNASVISARKLLGTTPKILIKAKLVYYSGIIAQQNNEFNKASELFDEAISLVNDNTLLYVEIKKAMLLNQHITELLDDSLEGLQLAYIDSFSQADNFTTALINHTYGDIYRYNEEFETALDYYFKAYETYEQFGYSRHFEQVLYSIALTHRDNNNRKEALEYLAYYERNKRSENARQQFLISYGYATIYSTLDNNYFISQQAITPIRADKKVETNKKNCSLALVHIEQALKHQGTTILKAELLKRKVRCLITFQKFQQSQTLLTKIKILYNDLPLYKNTSWQLEILQLEAQIAYAQKLYPKSFLWFEKYYKQSLIEQKNRSKFRYNVNEKLLLTQLNEMELSLMELHRNNGEQFKLLSTYKHQKYKYLFLLFSLIIATIAIVLIQHKKSQRALLSVTSKDKVTGVYDRNYMMSYMQRLLDMANYKSKVSFLLIELDSTPIINESSPFNVKDSLLCQLTSLIQASLRTEYTLGRLDNDKFLCVLPLIEEEVTMNITNRLVESVANYSFSTEHENNVKMTVSVGVRIIEASSKCNVDEIYNDMLKALIRAKKFGKNQAVIFKERYTHKKTDN